MQVVVMYCNIYVQITIQFIAKKTSSFLLVVLFILKKHY